MDWCEQVPAGMMPVMVMTMTVVQLLPNPCSPLSVVHVNRPLVAVSPLLLLRLLLLLLLMVATVLH